MGEAATTYPTPSTTIIGIEGSAAGLARVRQVEHPVVVIRRLIADAPPKLVRATVALEPLGHPLQ